MNDDLFYVHPSLFRLYFSGLVVNGSGSDDCMVDISEEVGGAETAASSQGSIAEQNNQLAEVTRPGLEAETVNKQASAVNWSHWKDRNFH